MSHPALTLTTRDFDAYLPEKATSNAYSRPRIEVKQRVLAWARDVMERLAELGIAVDMHASDEHPTLRNKKRVDCQWVFFWRDQAAREELDRLLDRGRSISDEIDDPSPYTRHAFLAFRIDASAVEVCFAVHPDAKVDIDNLRARLATAGDGTAPATADGSAEAPVDSAAAAPAKLAAGLTSALRALPEEFSIGVRPEDRVACSTATPEAILEMLARAAAGQTPLWIGWLIPRETAIDHSAILDEQLGDAIVALAPIYRLVAWSRENDHLALDRRIEGLEQERARTHAEAVAQNEKWQAEQAAARERSRQEALARVDEAAMRSPPAFRPPQAQGRRPSLDTLFKPQGGSPSHNGNVAKKPGRPHAQPGGRGEHAAPHAPRHDARHDGTSTHAAGATARPHHHEQQHARAAETTAASAHAAETSGGGTSSAGPGPAAHPGVVEKGARVRVKTGAFADKVGVVGELDGRGGARILLGLLSTRLDVADLEPVPEGRERPALQSSHRRPIAAAPRKTR